VFIKVTEVKRKFSPLFSFIYPKQEEASIKKKVKLSSDYLFPHSTEDNLKIKYYWLKCLCPAHENDFRQIYKSSFAADIMETVHKKDFVEIKFSGYANGVLFDSNIEEDMKKINPEAKAEKMIICAGEGMVVPGLDRALEEKEFGREYEVKLSPKDAFGERKRELVKTIPLSVFTQQKIEPYPGLVLSMDGAVVRIIAISGARVLSDFNNPLSGKEILYKFSIVRRIDDEKEKCTSLFQFYLRFVPDFDVKDKIIVKGPKAYEAIVKAFGDKFKNMIGKEMSFELQEKKEEAKKEIQNS